MIKYKNLTKLYSFVVKNANVIKCLYLRLDN
jgi:hypothetical protein